MKKIIKPIPLILVLILIFYFSLKTPTGNPSKIAHMDKVGHFIAYFSLAIAIFLSIGSKLWRVVFLILGLAVGVSLEIIQGQLTYREMSLMDGVTNTLGLVFGTLIFNLLYKQIKFILGILRLEKIFID